MYAGDLHFESIGEIRGSVCFFRGPAYFGDPSSTMTTVGHREIILSDQMPGYASGQTIFSRAVQSLCLFMSVLLSSQDVITRTFSCAVLETIRRRRYAPCSHTVDSLLYRSFRLLQNFVMVK